MSKAKLKSIASLMAAHEQERLLDRPAPSEPIAIIGLAGRYPQADHYYAFWEKLKAGANLIEEVPQARWNHSHYYDPNLSKGFVPNKTRCKHGAFIHSFDCFDADFFEIDHDAVIALDPQERIALETAWSCLEDAGYTPDRLAAATGLFSGMTYGEYQKLVPISSHACMLNNRIAYFMNFQGPTVTTDAGCCSSLTAIHLACESLRRKECETALVTGANLILHPDHYTSSSSMLSPSALPESNPYGMDDGWIPAEGVVSVLLKPLEQAEKDRDHIYAVIKSSYVGNEGKTSWFGAFHPKRQAGMIEAHFAKSGIRPETISYVEAAANGSSLGDAIEFEGLASGFRAYTDETQYCPIGSVKSNVGHGEAASTMLQLTKLLLQFQSGTLLPMLRTDKTNPHIRMEESPFYLLSSQQAWERPEVCVNGVQIELPRRATLSSFGAGGSVGHLICEEYRPESERQPELELELEYYFIPLSAKSVEQLKRMAASLADAVEARLDSAGGSSGMEGASMLDIMFTLCAGRAAFDKRVAIIADNPQVLVAKLRKFVRSEEDSSTYVSGDGSRRTEQAAEALVQRQAWKELASSWVSGDDVDWDSFFAAYPAHRVSLPTYSFNWRRFALPQAAVNQGTLTGEPVNSPVKKAAKDVEQAELSKQLRQNEPVKQTEQTAGSLNSGEERFLAVFAEVLQMDRAELSSTIPLERLGFHSAMVIRAASMLEERFGPVPKTLFFECQTIGEVMMAIQRLYPHKMEGWSDFTAPNQQVSVEELTDAILSGDRPAEWIIQKL